MRVIAGKYKGRAIHSPKGLPVRPTTDRTREALFNILGNYVEWEGMRVLDVFCGTGAVSLEFLSRGVAHVTCVDQHARCIGAVKRLVGSVDAVQQVSCIRMDAHRYVKKGLGGPFDLIFMDPPYEMDNIEGIVLEIAKKSLLNEGGILILEHSSHRKFDTLPNFAFARQYGSSTLSFFGDIS